jgi:sulfite exporter TauE/SafE
MSDSAHYAKLIAVITSAVAVVTLTFSLFGSVLKDLLPLVQGAEQAVNFFSFGTLIVLLALTLLIRQRIKVLTQGVWAVIGVALMVVAVFVFFDFSNLVNTYVYLYPESTAPQTKYIRGDYSPEGLRIVAGRSTGAAIEANGGPNIVHKYNMLWTQASRNNVIDKMVRHYAAITFLMTTALYVVSIAVWRSLPNKAVAIPLRDKPAKGRRRDPG